MYILYVIKVISSCLLFAIGGLTFLKLTMNLLIFLIVYFIYAINAQATLNQISHPNVRTF